jgi:hypothetical protein
MMATSMGRQHHKSSKSKPATQNRVMVANLNPGLVTAEFAQGLALLSLENPHGAIVGTLFTRATRAAAGRNTAIRRFLEDGDAEWLLWIDSDMVFDAAAFKVIYDEAVNNPDVKISAGLCFMWDEGTHTILPNIFHRKGNVYESDRFYTPGERFWCDATGVAFVLIHKDVFEAVGYPWHQDWFEHPELGGELSHDISFFHEAGKHGFRVRYCADAKVGHVKSWQVHESSYAQQLAIQREILDGVVEGEVVDV